MCTIINNLKSEIPDLKSEILIPKSETNPKFKIPNPKKVLNFEFVSDFDIRISDLLS